MNRRARGRRSIKQKVLAREMPPWFIDKNVGVQHFSNDVSLTDQEIATIVKWVDGGRSQGNPADMPPPRQFPDGPSVADRQAGSHRELLPKDVIVKAKAPDQWPDILVDPGLTEDRYVQGGSDHSRQGLSGHPPHPDLDRRAHGCRASAAVKLDGNVVARGGRAGRLPQ